MKLSSGRYVSLAQYVMHPWLWWLRTDTRSVSPFCVCSYTAFDRLQPLPESISENWRRKGFGCPRNIYCLPSLGNVMPVPDDTTMDRGT